VRELATSADSHPYCKAHRTLPEWNGSGQLKQAGKIEFAGTSRFEILSRVGQGAIGIVYEALDRETNTRVALKTLRNMSPETILLLKSEFRTVADLQHPNLVQLGELFEDGGNWFFTMEYVDGVDFLRHVRPWDRSSKASVPPPNGLRDVTRPLRAASFDEQRLRSTLVQLVRGLRVLHAAKKIHRDMKPSNILVSPSGRAAILDFGITKDLVGKPGGEDDGVVGTASYMAPEQVLAETLGPPADWYAVGVILYQALTGQLPFIGPSYDVMMEKLRREPVAPHLVVSGVPHDLEQLCMELLRIDSTARPDGSEILRRLQGDDDEVEALNPSAQTAVFVGRRSEMRTIEDAFGDAMKGEPVVLYVHGESGVGKSFLVRTFTERLTSRDPTTVLFAGRCYERESVPYKAVDGVVDDVTELLKRMPDDEVRALLPDNVALLAQVFPVLGSVTAIAEAQAPADVATNPQEQRVRVFAALRQLLSKIAARFTLVLVIDDLQWADADSMTLLAEVLRPPHAPSLLLIATMRVVTESMQRVRTAQYGASRITGDVRNLLVEKLPPDDARALITELLGSSADAAELLEEVRAIAEDAGGPPLFIDELVRQRATRGKDQAPLRLDDALWGRVTHLDPGAKQLLELVCVAGLPIPQEVAAQAVAVDAGQLFPRVAALRASHFVRTSGVRREDTIEPYHDRVRESVLAHLDGPSRTDWHARLALALERTERADAESLSIHWHGAGNPARAAEYAARAGDHAMSALAFERAVRLYRFAIELREPMGVPCDDLRARLAEALTNAGHGAEAAETRLALAKHAAPIAARDMRRRAAEQLLCSGHFDRGVGLLREVLAASKIRFPQSPVAVIAALLFFRLLLMVRGLRFTPREARAIEPADLVRIDSLRSAGAGFSMSDNIRGAYFQTRALTLALSVGDPERIVRALSMEVCFSAAGGTRARARTERLLAELQKLSAGMTTPEAEAFTCCAAGYTKYFLGEWRASREWLERAVHVFRDQCIGSGFEMNSARLMLYRVISSLGDYQSLAEQVPPAFREVEAQGDRYSSINLRASPMAALGLAADDPGRVRAEIGQANEWLSKKNFLVQHYFCVVAEAQCDLYEGKAMAGYDRMTGAWPALRRSMLLRVQSIRLAALEQRARCAVAAAVQAPARRDELLAAAEENVRLMQREKNDVGDAQAALLRACIAAVRGERAAAIEHATAAARAFDATHMAIWAAAAHWHLGRLTGGPRGAEAMTAAVQVLEGQTVKNPAKMIAMHAPGLGQLTD
jgi:serine/threonine protein kinase